MEEALKLLVLMGLQHNATKQTSSLIEVSGI
jgi:hypothetical protein